LPFLILLGNLVKPGRSRVLKKYKNKKIFNKILKGDIAVKLLILLKFKSIFFFRNLLKIE